MKKKLFRLSALLMALCLIFALAACGSEAAPASSAPAESAPEPAPAD